MFGENPFDKINAAIDDKLKNTAYKDKNLDAIAKDVKEEFNRVDKWGYRDDQEIYQSGMNIIDRYIRHISLAKNMRVDSEKWGVKNGKAELMKSQNIYKEEALKFFKEKRREFSKSWVSLSSGINLTSSAENRRLINKVATDINSAENEALKKIKLVCNPKQENLNAEEDSSVARDRQGNVKLNGAEIVRQKPMFTVDKGTGLITFTDRSNPVKIHDSLKGLFKKDGIVYEIDYTHCKNENIKKKMMNLTGGEAKCLISFDKTKGTYLIRNHEGKTWENRALIREGVTLKRDELNQWDAREKKKTQNAKLGTVDAQIDSDKSPEEDPKLKKFTEQMPNELKEKLSSLGTTEYRRFIIETENRLNTILKEGKAEQYELHAEPVSKKNYGLMEVHFVNDYAEKDVTVFDSSNKSLLGDRLYNMLDGSEDLMKEYVTSRVQEKWREFDDLTVRENSLASHERTDLKEEEKLSMEKYQSISNGIRMLNKFIDEHRQTEGDSWLDNGDKYLASIVRKVRDLEYSIKESMNTVSATDIENEIITKAISIAKDWDDYIHDTTTYKETFQRKFRDIFLGTKEQQIDAIRYLSRNESLMDRTESSFLADEIVTSETEVDESGNITVKGGLEVNDATINTYFQNINTCLLADLNYAESGEIIPNAQTQNIDELYNAASDSTGEGIVNVLISKQMIPEAWRNNSDVKKRARELAKNLNEQMKIANSFTIETIKEGEAKEKLELEMKSNKTEADLQRLQALNYLEHHPNEAAILHQQVLQKTKEEIKYGGVNNTVRRALASVFVEEGGGAKGANADIYNDIVGYGAFDLSDENAKIMGEILVEITITVAIAVATGGMGAAATAGLLRVCATGARAAKWVKTAERIRKIASLSKNGYRGLSASSKVAKFAVDAPGLLFEGTIFNNASKTIHAAFNGTSLDSLNFNPLTRENIETAAFLCALGIGNQIAGKGFKVLDKPGKYVRTKLHLNPSESLKSIGKTMNEVGAEMGGMLLATEGINLTFGHEVVDPDTGEVKTERGLSWPTNEEWATMIGMIIAFKAVKPGMWRKLADKLNDGTLIVCRTENRKNPVIRNTKTGMIVPIKDLPKNTDILNGGERTARGTGEGTGERTGEGTGERRGERTEETGDRTRERTEETGEGTRERTEETGDRAREETEEIQDIEQVRRELAEKESRLKGEENEAAALSRNIERLKRRTGTMDERQKERLERFEENLAKRNEDIAKLREEIQRDKDLIKKYEASHPQNQPENESDASYFDGKKSRFNISEATARGNSTIMDRMMDATKSSDFAFLRDTISIQYKAATGKDCPELTDQQLKTIIEAHKQLGELGNLTQGELLRKVRVLSETITDANFRRFLLESGFCGKGGKEGIDASFKKSLVDRDQFADTISKNRREKGGYPKGKIEIRKGVKLSVDRFFKKHPNLKIEYEEALKIQDEGQRSETLSKIDVELAEQRILESGRYIEFGVGKAEKAQASYDALNKVYNGRIERIVRDDGTIVLKLKEEVVPAPKQEVVPAPKGEVVPVPKGEVVPATKGEIVKTEPGLLTVIESGNVPAVIGERLPATITLKGGEIVPTEKVMPPAVQKKLNTALAVIEKRGGLPAVIQKNPEIIPVLPSKGIVPPYWLVPLLLIPGLNWSDEEKHSIIIGIPKDISDSFDKLIENPKITGVELPTDITGPFDSRGNMNAIKSEIDTKFDDLLRENNIQAPIKNNALILLRGVSSRTYRGRGDGEQYNKDLSLTRAEEFKKYLMQKFPELTDDNFVLDSHYQPDNIDEAQRFQGVSMGVVDMQKYGGITSMRQLIPSGQDGRVL